LSGKVEMSLNVLADDGLLVVAGNVVPFDSVSVEIVQYSHARLGVTVLLDLLSVVGLSAWGVESSGGGPVMEGTRRVGRRQSSLVSRPKPSVNVLGEEIRTVASVKVTKSARGPEIGHVTIDESLDPIVFSSRLKADQVHATFSAVVSGVEPIPLSVPDTWVVVQPGEEIKMVAKPLDSALVHSVSAEDSVREAQLSSSRICISATVTWI